MDPAVKDVAALKTDAACYVHQPCLMSLCLTVMSLFIEVNSQTMKPKKAKKGGKRD